MKMAKTIGKGRKCMDHTIALIRKSHAGNRTARAQLVEENTGLVWCIVKRYFNRGVEAEDLFQIGTHRTFESDRQIRSEI